MNTNLLLLVTLKFLVTGLKTVISSVVVITTMAIAGWF